MDGFIRPAVKREVMLVAVDAERTNVDRSVEKGLVYSGFDVQAFVFLKFAGAHLEDGVACKRRPEIDLLSDLPDSHIGQHVETRSNVLSSDGR